MNGEFQVYSCYSFQNSTILIDQLCARAKELKMESLGLCDIDNMYGAMAFFKACQKYGLKPIFGMQASVMVDQEIYPFILLAKDQKGYHDLMKISSEIQLSDIHAIELDQLALYHEHLFVISGCDEGLVERLVLRELESEAMRYMEMFKKLFHDHYYICLHNHHLELQTRLNERLIALATLERIKIIASNDVHYLYSQDALTLELLQASRQNRHLEPNFQPMTDQRYLKDRYEMSLLFSSEIINETNELLKRCNVTIETGVMHLPKYPLPQGATSEAYLRELCIVGLKKRFNNRHVPQEYIERLKKELTVIHKMGYNDYFLIVFDYVRYAKTHQILVGPGRGSAAGSLVSYVLGITNVDPLQYDLLFERFLNEDRVSMPDIDIDFQDDRRDEVVEYVTHKYGQEHVGQIVTFSTYGPKTALKDLGKVISVPLPRLELMSKYIPTNPKNKKTVKEVYETSYAFSNLVNQEYGLQRILPAVYTVEHLPRNISMHAAGVVLSNDCLSDVVPLAKGPNKNVLTQYSKKYIEEAGLLKMDFLGLKNLTIISHILKNIEQHDGVKIQLGQLDYKDKKTYDMLSRADTLGVFQLESEGMKNLLRQLKPNCLEDIIAALALFRPGPMQSIPTYLNRRFLREQVEYPVPELKDILKPTYGIIIYQEQIIQIVQLVAGFTLAKADSLRKAISDKKIEMMQEMKSDFIEGAISHHYKKEVAEKLYDLIEKFADYGFNKAHAVAYGMISYQLAYLKANYPLSFYGAVLTGEQSSESQKASYIMEAKRYDIKVLPPSINYSTDCFEQENGHLRYSLLGIKNVGMAGYRAIIEERQKNGLFKDLFDFVSRMDNSKVNSKMFESLIDAGAFDEFKLNRATIRVNMKKLFEYAELKNTVGIEEPPILDDAQESRLERLEKEKKVLGLYLTQHPIVYVKERLNMNILPVMELKNHINQKVSIVLSITKVRAIVDRKGNDMCFIEGYDETGTIECVVFSTTYSKVRQMIERGRIVYIEGKVDCKDRLSLIVNDIKEIK